MSTGAGDDTDALMEAAQRAAGVLAARRRGDQDGVDALMAQFTGAEQVAGGAMLLAMLSLQAQAHETGRTFDECVEAISLQLGGGVRR